MEGDFGLWVGLEDFLRLHPQPFIHFVRTRQAGAAGCTVHGPRQNFVLGAGAFYIFKVDTLYACVFQASDLLPEFRNIGGVHWIFVGIIAGAIHQANNQIRVRVGMIQ
nr:hypothetical protein [Xanthomonas arboricola]